MRRALVDCTLTVGTTSLFRYLTNSAASFSSRSVVSLTVRLKRAEASSAVRLGSLIIRNVLTKEIFKHAEPCHYFVRCQQGQSRQRYSERLGNSLISSR